MKKFQNNLGGNTTIEIIAIFVFILAIFLMLNTEIHFVNINYPKLLLNKNIPEFFWSVGLIILGIILLIIGLTKKNK